MKALKNLILCLATIFFFQAKAIAQTPYNDAVALEKLLDPITHKWPLTAKTQVAGILANYCTKDNVPNLFFDNNDFIGPYAVNFVSRAGISGGQNPVASAIGGFNVTNMANGLALFLIDRAKGEIDEAFFVRLNDFLAKYPEFATLFPNTKVFLSNFKSWEYANLLSTLKEAFNKDIKSLPGDLIKLKTINCTSITDAAELAKCIARVKAITDFLRSKDGLLFLSACKIGDGLIQGQKIPEIINLVIKDDYLLNPVVGLSTNAKNGLQLLNIVNKSLQSNETGKSYITEAQFDLLGTDTILCDLYLGLIWQQMQIANLIFTNNTTTVTLTNDVFTKTQIDGITSYITNVYNQTKNVQTAFDNLKKDKLDAKTNLSPDYAALIESVQQVVKALRTTAIIDTRLVIPADADAFFEKADNMMLVAGQLYNGNYSAATMGSLSLINSAIQSYDPTSTHKELATFCQDFLKYTAFAANFVEAKTPEDAKAAIEAVALPAGSYTIKQKSDWNISLNGYAGYIYDINYANGIYAPVGFAFSHGSRKKNGWAMTIFTGLIDVGSLVSYNLQSGSTNTQKQEVRLESIFSPSAQFFLGIGRTPISFGGGYRRTPKLFYNKTDGNVSPVPAKGVVSVSVLIDIPIFTLHNTPFK